MNALVRTLPPRVAPRVCEVGSCKHHLFMRSTTACRRGRAYSGGLSCRLINRSVPRDPVLFRSGRNRPFRPRIQASLLQAARETTYARPMSWGCFTRRLALVVSCALVACRRIMLNTDTEDLPEEIVVQVGEKGGTVKAKGVSLVIPGRRTRQRRDDLRQEGRHGQGRAAYERKGSLRGVRVRPQGHHLQERSDRSSSIPRRTSPTPRSTSPKKVTRAPSRSSPAPARTSKCPPEPSTSAWASRAFHRWSCHG